MSSAKVWFDTNKGHLLGALAGILGAAVGILPWVLPDLLKLF